ncbi:ribonuclease HII [Tepiditoga spiralis]|uniref:Ribonuclease n=1 Tax=Tepiditoga spiralis TaxID=2108365 RepID=A0A7G1G756_9BACT|nr:ribonuclease HII [Tepiditoga spiralis]BBE31004.1 ribonuclease HII [Tepiditoga spiralis]
MKNSSVKDETIFDLKYFKKYGSIIGLDEAGRGPLAGPVFAAAVYVENENELKALKRIGADSKTLSEKEREKRYNEIIKNFKYSYYAASSELIDEMNIFKATQYAMKKCVEQLNSGYCLIDGKNFHFSFPFECIVKGDSKLSLIGAASIIAKVLRDKYMIKLSEKYPEYLFYKHKGYPTKEHVEKIKKYGIFNEYRLTFNPVKSMIINNEIQYNKNDFSKNTLMKLGVL